MQRRWLSCQHSCDAPRQFTVADGGFHLHLNQTILQFTNATTQEKLVWLELAGNGKRTIWVWCPRHVKADHLEAFDNAFVVGARVAVDVHQFARERFKVSVCSTEWTFTVLPLAWVQTD